MKENKTIEECVALIGDEDGFFKDMPFACPYEH